MYRDGGICKNTLTPDYLDSSNTEKATAEKVTGHLYPYCNPRITYWATDLWYYVS